MIVIRLSMAIQSINAIKEFLTKLTQFSPESLWFMAFVLVVLGMNVAKKSLVLVEKRKGRVHGKCDYLKGNGKTQYCSLPACADWFIKNQRGCSGCKKKTTSISNEEAETRAINSSFLKRLVIFAANGGKSILPYLSFVYTLTLAVMGISKSN